VHQKSGCEWTGELGELDQHLNLNPELGKQLIGCVFAAVACTHCCEYFQRCRVHAHESESCPQRPFSCDYCDDYGSVYEDVVTNHWPVCKCYPVPCPNKCGVNPERQNIEMHVTTKCPLTIVNCDFHYTGCEVQLARMDMPTHLAECLTTHISLLTAQTQTMAGSGAQGHLAEHLLPHLSLLALHNQQLTQLTMQLKQSLEESQRKIQELERENQTQATKLQDISEMNKREIEREKQVLAALSVELQKACDTSQRKIEVLENDKEAQTAAILELQKTSNINQRKIEMLEKEKQVQATVNADIQRSSKTNKQEIHEVIQENEALKREVNEVVKEEIAQLRKGKEEEMKTLETSLQVAMAESQSMKQETTELRRKQEEDRASLATLQQYIGMFPVKLMMTNFPEMKSSNGEWYSPPFYTHPLGYKMCLRVVANGCGKGKGTHVSVYAYLMRGEFDDHLKWPFHGRVVIQLRNQLQDKYHRGHFIKFNETTDAKATVPVISCTRADKGVGTSTLIPHEDLNFNPTTNCQYLKNDCLHFQIVAVESLSEPGVLPTELTVTNFEQHKLNSDNWFSPSFYTHPQGYKMCLAVYANGDDKGKGTHVSVFAFLMRGKFDDHLKWPFRAHVTVAMLNRLEDNYHTTQTIRFSETTNSRAISRVTEDERAQKGYGYHTFVAHTELNYNPAKNCQYLKYDCLRFRIVKVELK